MPNRKTLQIRNISWLFEVLLGTRTIFRRVIKVGYKYAILWLRNYLEKQKQNIMVDALSRKEDNMEWLPCVISILKFDWVE